MVAPADEMASLVAGNYREIYKYHFASAHSYHSEDLNFVFGAPLSGIMADEMKMGHNSNEHYDEKARDLSRRVMTMWTNFAKYRHVTAVLLMGLICPTCKCTGISGRVLNKKYYLFSML